MIQEVARGFKTKIMLIYVDTAEEKLAKPFLTLYGLEPEKPTGLLLKPSGGYTSAILPIRTSTRRSKD
jgi:protein disulfide-isomerase A1